MTALAKNSVLVNGTGLMANWVPNMGADLRTAMNARSAKRLYDGKQAAIDLAEYSDGQTLDGFLGEEMWRFAVERKAGVLASAMESAVREAPELADRLPHIDRVIGLRECLTLDAGDDERRRMWVIVTDEVPELLVAIDAELAAFGIPDENAPLEPGKSFRPIDLILDNLMPIAALCREYLVEQLDVFGSATTGAFDLETSDIDFLVRYLPESEPTLGRYLELEAALSELLGRKIDLVQDREFENPYFRQSVRMSRVRIYPVNRDDLEPVTGSRGEADGRDSSLRSE